MITIILRTIRDRWRTVMTYSAISIGLVWMYIALFPSFAQEADRFKELFASYPKAFLDAFGIESVSMETIEHFLVMEHYSLLGPILFVILGLSLAGFSFASEVEHETVTLTLAQPISRRMMFWGRWVAGSILMTIFTIISVYSPWIFGPIHGVKVAFGNYHALFLAAESFALAIFSLALFGSTWLSDKGRLPMIGGGVFILMYAAGVVSRIRDSLEGLQYASILYYFDAEAILVDRHLSTFSIIVLIGVIILATLVAKTRWARRDVL